MTISYVSVSAVGTGTTPLNITQPTSISQGNLLLMFIGQKPTTANAGTVTTPTGWTLIGEHNAQGGYGTTVGVDVGNTNLRAYYKIADGNESGVVLAVTTGGSSVAWGVILNYSKTLFSWAPPAFTTAARTTAPTSPISVTFGANPGITSGDQLAVAFCIATDVTTPNQFSVPTLTATGATLAASTERREPDSATGNDIGGVVTTTDCTAGTASAAPVWGATLAGTLTNVRGPLMLVRLREGSGNAAPLDGAGSTDTRVIAQGLPADTLTDDFATQDTAKWDWFAGANVSGGTLTLPCTTSYGSIYTKANYNLDGYGIHAALVTRPTGNGSTESAVGCNADFNGDDRALIVVADDGSLICRETTNNVNDDVNVGAWNSTTMKYIGIALSGTTLTWRTSPDGSTWTTRRTKTTSLDYRACIPAVWSGHYAAGADGTAVFDNFNLTDSTNYTQTPTDNAVPTDGTTSFVRTALATNVAAPTDSAVIEKILAITATDNAVPTDSTALTRNEVFEDGAGVTDAALVDKSPGPADYSDLTAWFRADALNLNDNDQVGTWFDSSGSGFNVTSSGTSRPTFRTGIINGKPVVRFDGSGDYLQNAAATTATNAGGFTSFVVLKRSSVATNVRVISNGNGNGYSIRFDGATRGYSARAVVDNLDGTYTVDTWEIWALTLGAGTGLMTLYVNGTSVGSNTNSFLDASGGMVIGAYETAAAEFFDGDIAEIATYSRPLTGSELNGVTSYLGTKYNITVAGGGTDHTQTPTDSADSTDTAALAKGWGVASTDNATPTDAATFARGEAFEDGAGLTDSAAIAKGWAVTATDNAVPTDSLLIALGRAVSATDDAGSTDTATFAQNLARTAQDDAGLTDTNAQDTSSSGTVTREDPAGPVDSATLARSAVASDAVAPTDSALIESGKAVAATDGAGLTDSTAITLAHGVSATDNAVPTDAATLARGLGPADGAGATDATTLTRGLGPTDGAGLTDAGIFTRGEVFEDGAGLTDAATVSKSGAGAVEQTDAAGPTDTFTTTVGKVAVDTAGPTDAIIRGSAAVDSAGASDTISLSRSLIASDGAGLAESTTVTIGGSVVRTDTAGAQDAGALDQSKAVSDAAGTSDTPVVLKSTDRTSTDDGGVTDSISITLTLTALDGAGLADATAVAYHLVVLDSTGVTDTAGVINGVIRDVTLVVTLAPQGRITAALGAQGRISATIATPPRITATLGAQP